MGNRGVAEWQRPGVSGGRWNSVDSTVSLVLNLTILWSGALRQSCWDFSGTCKTGTPFVQNPCNPIDNRIRIFRAVVLKESGKMKILWPTTVISETLGWCPAIWVLTSPSDDSDTDMLELTSTIKEAFIFKFMCMNKLENKGHHKCYVLSTSHAFSSCPGPENNALGESNDPNIGAKFIDLS